MLEDLLDSGKSQLIIVLCILLPVGVTAATAKLESTVQEFRVFRLAQYDLAGNSHGSRAWRVSHEAAALGSAQQIRRALVVWWADLAADPSNLGGLLHAALGSVVVVLPKSLAHFTGPERDKFLALEKALLATSWPMPIYFGFRTQELGAMLDSLAAGQAAAKGSALTALVDAVTANAFQVVSGNSASSVTIDKPLYNIVGKLSAYERGGNVPTIVVVAHYDSFGAAPALSAGADANGSGVAALLELLRLFHRLYQSPKTRPKYNMVFLLSGGGKVNYQGALQWITEHQEQDEADVELALCLDSLGGGRELFAHVSKAPKEDSPLATLQAALETSAEARGLSATLVPKRISLSEPLLAWEHERFNIKRIRALTLSRLPDHTGPERRTILDTRDAVDTKALAGHVETIAEALLSLMFRLGPGQSPAALLGPTGVSWAHLESWTTRLASGARALPALAAAGKESPILADLLGFVETHSHGAEARPIPVDAKEPEVVLFGALEDSLGVHRVKPAVFDLLLASAIAAYLGLAYAAVMKFQLVYPAVQLFAGRFLIGRGKAN